MKSKWIVWGAGYLLSLSPIAAQNPHKAVFIEKRPGFYQHSILRDDREVKEKMAPPQEPDLLVADLSGLNLPNKKNLYAALWHQTPVSQGNTGSCWCFSTTSLFESEVFRLTGRQVKLSEMYTVYWEYVEKTRRYIRERGNSVFEEGSEANAVPRIWNLYGIVPAESYTGLLHGRIYHNHADMIAEMKTYLQAVKASASWDEHAAIGVIRAIMDHHMGPPPVSVMHEGKSFTPRQYLTDLLKLDPNDYVDILSYMQEPFYRRVEYRVPDNWWHSTDFNNVPLEVFMAALKGAIRKGFTVSIGGDVSEPGFDRNTQCAVVPDFDIPASFINDDARQFRFYNKTTTDDHGLHLVGYLQKDGKDWYLVKDSGSGSRNNEATSPEFGYYFFSEDYVKLKMMDFMVHKDAVTELLRQIKP